MIDFDITIMAKRIKELRLALGLTQKQLGEKIGVEQNTIANYERCYASPSLSSLVHLAVVLETTTDYLLGIKDWE